MAIFYYPYPTTIGTSAPAQFAVNDLYVDASKSVKKIVITVGKSLAAYGLSTPKVPTSIPPVIASTLAASYTATANQSFTFNPVSAYGGSAAVTSLTAAGSQLIFNV
jgi:hypothetical protein